MVRAYFAGVVVATASICAATSCSSFSSDATTSVPDLADAADAPASDGSDGGDDTGTPDGGTTDGSAVLDAHVAVDGAVIDDSFESSVTCDGWSPINGATALPTSPGHTGARSCLLCGGASSGIRKNAPVTGGPFQVLAWVRDPGDGGGSSAYVSLGGYGSDGGASGFANGTAMATATWSLLQAVLPADAVTTSVSIVVTPEGTGTAPWCVLVDDISLTQQ